MGQGFSWTLWLRLSQQEGVQVCWSKFVYHSKKIEMEIDFSQRPALQMEAHWCQLFRLMESIMLITDFKRRLKTDIQTSRILTGFPLNTWIRILHSNNCHKISVGDVIKFGRLVFQVQYTIVIEQIICIDHKI